MLIQRATSNTTADDLLASLVTTFSFSGQDIRRRFVDAIWLGLQTCLRKLAFWGSQGGVSVTPHITNIKDAVRRISRSFLELSLREGQKFFRAIVSWSYRAKVFLWRIFGISEILRFIGPVLFRILKFCGIALAIPIGIIIVVKFGYWALPKIWKICKISFQMLLEEIRERKERRRYAKYLREEDARQAAEATAREAEAAAREEARLRRAREAQAIEDKRKRDEKQRVARARADYETWDKICDSLFRTRTTMASMTKFPFPPLPQCTYTDPLNPIKECPNFRKNPVVACEHNVKQFFRGSGKDLLTIVQRHRILCHEDKFASCSAALRPEFIRLATSLFVVLDPWHKELKGQQAK